MTELVSFVLASIGWILEMQRSLLEFFLDSPTGWVAAGKYVFLLFPVLLFVAAAWCTQVAMYTIPFRSKRINFIQKMLFAWWDAARAVLLFWVGLFRFVSVAVGWCLTLVRLAVRVAVESVGQILTAPFSLTGRMSRSYFQPGVPWIAFLMLIFWCCLEATIFTYTLLPTVSEVLADLVGMAVPRLMGPVLFLFLLILILGSFACLQVLLDTFKKRQFKFIVQMLVVELFVMLFEVMFLYRELVDAITPWIAQQTGEQFRLGITFTLSLAAFGWIGIRGMTWFLFGQFGTPPLLAFISRRPLPQQEELASSATPGMAPAAWWRAPIQEFKTEIDWLHSRSEEIVEYLTLPLLQILASAMNFAMILLTASPVMSLPLRGLNVLMRTRDLAGPARAKPQPDAMESHSAQVSS